MPFADGVIDLIVTSPPYANAIDYMRAHKFSLVWLGKSVGELVGALRAEYIGSERVKGTQFAILPRRPEGIIRAACTTDKHKSEILRKYFTEMKAVLAEMYRVLRSRCGRRGCRRAVGHAWHERGNTPLSCRHCG